MSMNWHSCQKKFSSLLFKMKNSPKVNFFFWCRYNSLNGKDDDDEESEIILKMKAQNDDDKKLRKKQSDGKKKMNDVFIPLLWSLKC